MSQQTNAKRAQLAKYIEWSKKYPGHLILMRSRYFYAAWGRSAEVINEILDYKLSYREGSNLPFTGGPNLDKILSALEKNCVNYIVIEKDAIVEKQEFQFCDEVFYKPHSFDGYQKSTQSEAKKNQQKFELKVGVELQIDNPPATVVITRIDGDTVQLMHKEIIHSSPRSDFFEGKINYFSENEFVIVVDLADDHFTALHYKSFDKSVLDSLYPKKPTLEPKLHPSDDQDSRYDYLKHYKNTTKIKKPRVSAAEPPHDVNNIPYNKMDGSPYSTPTYSRSRSAYDKKSNRKRFEGTGR